MKAFVFLTIIAISYCHVHQPYFTKETYQQITETAKFETVPFEKNQFKYWSEAELRSLFGTFLPSHKRTVEQGECNVPDSFDARQQWPNCIHPIRDQQHCGSCWAFAASEVLSDRFCIASNGQIDVVLSPEDMVSCDTGDMGCNGGYLDASWEYLRNEGIVSDDCLPYSSGDGQTGYCPSEFSYGQCPTGAEFKKYRASGYTHYNSICDIQQAIMNEGPVETGFTVYRDLMAYQGGVYTSDCSQQLGGHAVKIVGWGNEGGRKYWIIANSWNSGWGESGFIRIEIGQSCLGLEGEVYAGSPDLYGLNKQQTQ